MFKNNWNLGKYTIGTYSEFFRLCEHTSYKNVFFLFLSLFFLLLLVVLLFPKKWPLIFLREQQKSKLTIYFRNYFMKAFCPTNVVLASKLQISVNSMFSLVCLALTSNTLVHLINHKNILKQEKSPCTFMPKE